MGQILKPLIIDFKALNKLNDNDNILRWGSLVSVDKMCNIYYGLVDKTWPHSGKFCICECPPHPPLSLLAKDIPVQL